MPLLPRILLTLSVALAAVPTLWGGRMISEELFAHRAGMNAVHLGTLIAGFVCLGACGHVWQRPLRSVDDWVKLCLLTTTLGICAFWFTGALFEEAPHAIAIGTSALSLLVFGAPFLLPGMIVLAILFAAWVRIAGLCEDQEPRPARLVPTFVIYAASALALTVILVRA